MKTKQTNIETSKGQWDNNLVYGKIPPQAKDIEQAILGVVMMEKDAFSKVSELLTENCFYVEVHQMIFKAFKRLDSRRSPIDVLTTVEELRSSGEIDQVGGSFYVTQLTNHVTNTVHTEEYCRLILQKYMKRKIIEMAGELITEGYEDMGDAFDLLDNAERELLQIRGLIDKRNYVEITTALVDQIQHLEKLRNREDHLTGIQTGFRDLDLITCGWQPTDLIILAARPSVGKTALALSLSRSAAKSVPVGLFSIEMSYRQLTTRLLSAEADFPMWLIRNGKLSNEQMGKIYKEGVQPLSRCRIFLDDTGSIKLSDLKSKARRMVKKDGVKIIFIDYLQLIVLEQRNKGRKDLDVGDVTMALKGLAKELDIPIVLLSQLSRDVEKRGGKEPVLSDLRESGAIEQDADVVLFLWRPSDGEIEEDAELKDMVNVKIEKHRNGSLAKFIGKFNGEIQKWEYLRVVDGRSLMPLPGNWKPISDYTEPKKKDNPF